MKAVIKRDLMIRQVRKRAVNLRKKYNKKRNRRKVELGGIESLEAGRVLRINREKVLQMLKKNHLTKKGFLMGLGIDPYFYQVSDTVKIERSKETPAINVFVLASGEETNHSRLIDFRGVGTIAVNIIHSGGYRIKGVDKGELNHEEAHTRTFIIRNANDIILTKDTKRTWKEKLLSEIISCVAGDHFEVSTTYGESDIIRKYFDGIKGSASKKLINLESILKRKKQAVSKALKVLPKGEVLMVLRQSSWTNIEKNLRERTRIRK
jgi:hypothetical protein